MTGHRSRSSNSIKNIAHATVIYDKINGIMVILNLLDFITDYRRDISTCACDQDISACAYRRGVLVCGVMG